MVPRGWLGIVLNLCLTDQRSIVSCLWGGLLYSGRVQACKHGAAVIRLLHRVCVDTIEKVYRGIA